MMRAVVVVGTAPTVQHGLLYPLLSRLPKGVAYRISDRVSKLQWTADFHRQPQRVTQWRKALHQSFPDLSSQEIDRLGIEHARMIGRDTLDAYRLPRMQTEEIQRDFPVHGLEILCQAHQLGRGVMLVITHFDRFFLLAPALGAAGYPFAMLTTAIDPNNPEYRPPIMYRYWSEKMANTIIHSRGEWVTTQDSLRSAYRLLEQGKILLLAVDGNESFGDRQTEQFFSTQIGLPQGAARILSVTGAQAVYASVHTDQHRPWRADIQIRPLEPNPQTLVHQSLSYLQHDLQASPAAWWQWRSLESLMQQAEIKQDSPKIKADR